MPRVLRTPTLPSAKWIHVAGAERERKGIGENRPAWGGTGWNKLEWHELGMGGMEWHVIRRVLGES